MNPSGFVVALLGAESTGKTSLSLALRDALKAEGRDATLVAEFLREFCEREGRTPRHDEQAAIAAEQTRRIHAAASTHEIVIADTTALMVAVYSDHVFADSLLYADAQRTQRSYGLTLVTALDLPWQADGLQREGEWVREPVDAKLRSALHRGGMAYSVIAGLGVARTEAALAAVHSALQPRLAGSREPRWQWHCERCGSAACEKHVARQNR